MLGKYEYGRVHVPGINTGIKYQYWWGRTRGWYHDDTSIALVYLGRDTHTTPIWTKLDYSFNSGFLQLKVADFVT